VLTELFRQRTHTELDHSDTPPPPSGQLATRRCVISLLRDRYSEPSRSAMGKHFRLRHAGMTIDVDDMSDPARDAEVVRLLDECAIDEEQDEINCAAAAAAGAAMSGGGCIKRSSLRNVGPSKQVRVDNGGTATPSPPTLTPATPSASSSRSREYRTEAAKQQMPSQKSQQRTKIKSMRLRRCPHCSYSSPSTKSLAQHVAVRHRPHRLRCGYCGHMSHYPSWLRKHSRKSHPDLPFNFISMDAPPEATVAQTGNSQDKAESFLVAGGEIPARDSPEPEDEFQYEQDQMTTGKFHFPVALPFTV